MEQHARQFTLPTLPDEERPFRALVVDDLPSNRALIQLALSEENFEVVAAADGNEALRLLAEQTFEVVLLDVMMPGTDGIEVCKRIRTDLGALTLPVIMLTAMNTHDQIEAAFAAGASDYITKPFNQHELMARVNAFARRMRSERELRASRDYLTAVMAHAVDGIIITDARGNITLFNAAAERIFGYSAAEAVQTNIATMIPEPYRSDYRAAMDEPGNSALIDAKPRELPGKRKGGDIFAMETSISELQFSNQRCYIWIVRDGTERKRDKERMFYLANFDSLTGLPNRNLFQDRLRNAVAHGQRSGELLALLYVDLDNFKRINDNLGHSTGDELLSATADRLRRCVRDSDTVARLGGDEFAILLQGVRTKDNAYAVARKVVAAMEKAFMLGGHEFYVTSSVGVTTFSAEKRDLDDILKDADAAMYRAKQLGKNRFQIYSADMNAENLQRLQLETELRHALTERQFVLHYQPQLALGSGDIVGVEALLRWQHPTRGLLFPDQFIPILEETGLIIQAGEFVLREACRQSRLWKAEGLAPVRVSVNLSARQFDDPDILGTIRKVLAETQMDPALLELEITESAIMRDAAACTSRLKEIDRMGISIAIDDFGTGYSSLAYLRQFPVDTLKIDRSFVGDVDRSSDGHAIPTAIIGMARALRLKVVAEGVENADQLRLLLSQRCDFMQGYYFSKPLPSAELTDLLRSGVGLSAAGQVITPRPSASEPTGG